MPSSKKSSSTRGGIFRFSRLRKPKAAVVPSPSSLLAELMLLSQRIAAHALRLKIHEVVAQTRTLLNYLQAQSESTQIWQDFVRDCLASAVAGTRKFTDQSPHLTEPSHAAVIDFHEFLAVIAQTLGSVHAQVTAEGATGFPAHVGPYQNTLRDINQAYFGGDVTRGEMGV